MGVKQPTTTAACRVTELAKSRMSRPHFPMISTWVRVYTLGSNMTTNLDPLQANQESMLDLNEEGDAQNIGVPEFALTQPARQEADGPG